MTYSIDTIPAKIYFKVLETQDFSLLSDEKIDKEALWDEISSEGEKMRRSDNKNKILDASKSMGVYSSDYKSIKAAIYYLERKRDSELEQMIIDKGYKLTNANFKDDLKKISNKVESLNVKIAKQVKKIESESKPKGESSFEDVYMLYMLIGKPYRTVNTILFTEFVAWERGIIKKLNHTPNHGSKR